MAVFFGVGRCPFAPGTAGSLAAALLAFGLHELGGASLLLMSAAAATAFGFWSLDGQFEDEESDPPWVVIDEVAGQFIALLPVSLWFDLSEAAETEHMIFGWLTGFLLFRILDIWKPWFIGRADKLAGATGIMLDDILAGATAGTILALIGVSGMMLGWVP